ncbi:hypothetical protein [Pseudoalteromonas denitrificans]|uniref:Uncharacterized protein n=1 Tax=Pseudoalteromonas denitrificans DSM 6059 TaxID=1123010 RepID=A0A1I1FIF4_9GAMM|nr:hypothetical protein [Pseudoalteromonas denitrificans]SFB99187.1 hypothetical protein SAMN02745724_00653 [Pseudoalteromonas denitrificans DSM 6059]
MKIFIFKLTILTLLFLVLGCKSTLTVKGDFPTPVVNKLPFTLGVIYDNKFKDYQYSEVDEKREEWEISVGDAQLQLFKTVLPAMFSNVIDVSDFNSTENNSIDIFFKPSIDELQYNVPAETKLNMFEVWIKYNMKVYDNNGQLLADWILTAYGKTPTAFMKSQESALNEAMVIALRDAGAGLTLKFSHIPEINTWLLKNK